ncbi:hypothetical protein B1J92_I06534g [Nakaseomyces glabratus]|nr:hypothetical protein B1J91_I06534g [Nakaseomyces glabratus]OXB47774.1 hypothetical protein B1J92_I06534g [Nakaseomyces glabratus]
MLGITGLRSLARTSTLRVAARAPGRLTPVTPSWRVMMPRYMSSNGKPISEITTQLPAVDELGATAADAVTQTVGTVGELSTHVGYLESIGLAQTWYWPSDLVQHALEYVHAYSGLPWWGTIITVTLLVRLALVPLYVKSSDTIARNSRIKPELDKINKQLMGTTDMTEGQKVAMKRKKLLADNGIKNRWLAAPMVQIPMAIGFFNGIRHMANFPVQGFQDQGILWFNDLTQADPYLGLQVITAAVLISFTRLGGETGAQQFSPTMRKFFTIMPLLSIPATMNLSSAVVLYFAVNGSFSVLQTLFLRNKWVRRKLNIADVVQRPVDPAQANKGIMDTFRENMANARAQAERKQKMQEKEMEMQELSKKLRENQRIKIVSRKQLNKNH